MKILILFFLIVFSSLHSQTTLKPVYDEEWFQNNNHSVQLIDSILSFYGKLEYIKNLNNFQKTIYFISIAKLEFQTKPFFTYLLESPKSFEKLDYTLKTLGDLSFRKQHVEFIEYLDSINFYTANFKNSKDIQNQIDIMEIIYGEFFYNLNYNPFIIEFISKNKDKIYDIKYEWYCNKHNSNQRCFMKVDHDKTYFFHFKRNLKFVEVYNEERNLTLYSVINKRFEIQKSFNDSRMLIEKTILWKKKNKIEIWNFYQNGNLKSHSISKGQKSLNQTINLSDSTCFSYYNNREIVFIDNKWVYKDNKKQVKFKYFSKIEKFDSKGNKIDTIIDK